MMAPQAGAPGPIAPVDGREASPTPQPRLLLVEDEVLVGLFMGEMLEDMDFSVTEPCRTLADGLAAAKNEKFDGAVLDMNLNGESVYPLADLLASLDVPFIFVTGYSADVVAERFAKIPIIQKPVAAETLAKILRLHLAKAAGPALPPAGDKVVAFAQAR
jgi:DNA-binding response OmpR family regulator